MDSGCLLSGLLGVTNVNEKSCPVVPLMEKLTNGASSTQWATKPSGDSFISRFALRKSLLSWLVVGTAGLTLALLASLQQHFCNHLVEALHLPELTGVISQIVFLKAMWNSKNKFFRFRQMSVGCHSYASMTLRKITLSSQAWDEMGDFMTS